LLVESCFEPEKFLNRLNARKTLKKNFAMIYLRNGVGGRIVSRRGLEIMRRLPAFHSIVKIPRINWNPPHPLLTTGDYGIAYFSHEDLPLFAQSLEILHALEDERGLYEVED
jgi:hypothetical protein